MESPHSSLSSDSALPPPPPPPPPPPAREEESLPPIESLSLADDYEDENEGPTQIRFLVSNGAAGSVIGKGGSTITEFQSLSGARIVLSRNNEFFPGTTDRIVLVSGPFNDILHAVELILGKLVAEGNTEESNEYDSRAKVRLIVPNSSCGAIIGKGGAMIKSFMKDSQASIKISPQDNNYNGLTDRLVTVTGSLEEQLRAIFLILAKLAEDSYYPHSMNAPFSYAGVNFSSLPYGYMAPSVGILARNGRNGSGGFQNNKEDRSNSVTIGVADEHVGLVVGRGGRNLMDINQTSGARIKISDRGDFISGTSERKVIITGSQAAIRTAENMIMQKVAYATESATES